MATIPMQRSHIWLGMFPSEAHFDDYFEEQYEDDDAPINKFAEEQGERYYDHDRVERSFEKSADLHRLIDGHSFSDDYIDKVIEAATTKGIRKANVFIMADVGEFANPQSIDSDQYALWYLDEYTCSV